MMVKVIPSCADIADSYKLTVREASLAVQRVCRTVVEIVALVSRFDIQICVELFADLLTMVPWELMELWEYSLVYLIVVCN